MVASSVCSVCTNNLDKTNFSRIALSMVLGVISLNRLGCKLIKTKLHKSITPTVIFSSNWGTESDPDSKYHNGNDEPKGFGHIGLMVPDVDAACARFEKLGVSFKKKPNEGKMKGIAFIQDPDGYWIEIFNARGVTEIV